MAQAVRPLAVSSDTRSLEEPEEQPVGLSSAEMEAERPSDGHPVSATREVENQYADDNYDGYAQDAEEQVVANHRPADVESAPAVVKRTEMVSQGASPQTVPAVVVRKVSSQREPQLAEPRGYSKDPSALMRNVQPFPSLSETRHRRMPSLSKMLHLPGRSSAAEHDRLSRTDRVDEPRVGTTEAVVTGDRALESSSQGRPPTTTTTSATHATQRKSSIVDKVRACIAPPHEENTAAVSSQPTDSSTATQPMQASASIPVETASTAGTGHVTDTAHANPQAMPSDRVQTAFDDTDVFQSKGPPDVSQVKPQYDYRTTPVIYQRSLEVVDKDMTPPNDYYMTSTSAGISSATRALGSVVVSRDGAAQGPARASSGTLRIRMDRIKQTMRGLGYSNAFYTNWWDSHPNKNDIFRLLFQELQPSVLRLRNAYQLEESSERDMNIDAAFIQAATKNLGYTPQILLTSWTPPARMKASGRLFGGSDNSVLGKDNRGRFLYYDFSRWWVDSVRAYGRIGITPTYVSIQNEPDYNPAGHPGCLFGVRESFAAPGYYRAAEEVFEAFKKEFRVPPVFIGPECFQMDAYISEHPYAGGGRFPAIANHLYSSGNQDDPYSYIPALERTREIAQIKQVQDVFMTEYAKLGRHDYLDPMRLGIIIHNTLTIADATMYLHWDGAWATGAANDEGTLLLVDDPFRSGRSHWRNDRGFTVLHSFYWFQHFTKFIRPGYRRVQVDIAIRDVLASAWTAPFGVFSMIMINTSTVEAYVTLLDVPTWIPEQTTDLYYSTLDVGFTYGGRFRGTTLTLLPRSITTIFSYRPN